MTKGKPDMVNGQWPFQEPIHWRYLPYIYIIYIYIHICLAYFLGLNFRTYPQKKWSNIWYVYVAPLSDPEILIDMEDAPDPKSQIQ